MLEVDITDLHFGRLTWGKESGEDYDVKIAREMALKAFRWPFVSCKELSNL